MRLNLSNQRRTKHAYHSRGGAASSAILAFAFVIPSLGQNPAEEIRIDNPQVRVIAVTEQPHRHGTPHNHPNNRVMIYLDSGRLIENLSGKTNTTDFKAGEVRWSPATGPHTTEYDADHPIRIIEVELKSPPHAVSAMPSNDPLKADSKHYSLVFENDQVRVLRVHFGPNEKGVLHEHKLPHIVCYLNDQARGKAGEVKLDEPMTHTEQNPLDHDVERIAIDLK